MQKFLEIYMIIKIISEKTFDRITGWNNDLEKKKDDDSLEL